MTVISGNGLIVRPTQGQSVLTVLVTDAQGRPAPNAAVTWRITGQGSLASQQSLTDINGQATNLYTAQQAPAGANFAQTLITAIDLSTFAFAQMTITTPGSDPNSPDLPFVNIELRTPLAEDTITGVAGSTGDKTIAVLTSSIGLGGLQRVPNVLVRLAPDGSGPTISCAENSGYSNTDGFAYCLPVLGEKLGTGRFTVDVGGGYRRFGPFNFTVTPRQREAFRILQGNNQSANLGAILPVELQAHLEDVGGRGLPNVPVVWEPVIPGTATITNASTASDINGNVSANVTLGTALVGSVQVRVRTRSGNVETLFKIQVNLPGTSLTKVSGDNQEAVADTLFAQPLVVQVNAAQGPVPGVEVQFTSQFITRGGIVNYPVFLVGLSNNGFATTNAQGQASITMVSAGTILGPAIVTARVGSLSTSFNLSIRPPGLDISLKNFFNGAGGQPGGVSPTSILAIYGNGIATGLQGCVSGVQILGRLPILLSTVTVLFTADNFASYAPIYSVCNLGPGQQYALVQVPAELPVGVASVTVNGGGLRTVIDNVPVTLVSPGIFETVYSDLKQRAVLLHEDGSYVSLESPARRGETLRAFVTGLGQPRSTSGLLIGTNQSGIPGDDAAPQPTVILGVNNLGVTPTSIVYAQDLIGVHIVNFVVPADSASGSDINFVVAAILNDNLIFGNPSKIPVSSDGQ